MQGRGLATVGRMLDAVFRVLETHIPLLLIARRHVARALTILFFNANTTSHIPRSWYLKQSLFLRDEVCTAMTVTDPESPGEVLVLISKKVLSGLSIKDASVWNQFVHSHHM